MWVVQSYLTFWESDTTVACQGPPPMGFSRQENWDGLPFPVLGDLPTQRSNPGLLRTLYHLCYQGSPERVMCVMRGWLHSPGASALNPTFNPRLQRCIQIQGVWGGRGLRACTSHQLPGGARSEPSNKKCKGGGQEQACEPSLPYTVHVNSIFAQSLSRDRLFTTPWTVAHQAPLSLGFSRQESWSGWPLPPPGRLPDPGTEPTRFFNVWATGEVHEGGQTSLPQTEARSTHSWELAPPSAELPPPPRSPGWSRWPQGTRQRACHVVWGLEHRLPEADCGSSPGVWKRSCTQVSHGPFPTTGSEAHSPCPALLGGSTKRIFPSCACARAQSLQSVWLSDPMDCSPPGSSLHGIFQARILPFPPPGDLPKPRDQTLISCVSCIVDLPTEPPGKPIFKVRDASIKRYIYLLFQIMA